MRASRLDVSHRPPPRPWRHPRSRDLVHRQRAEANDDPGALAVCHSDSLSRANGKVRRGLCRLDVMAQHVLRKQVGGKPVLELTDGNLLFGGCRQVGRIGPRADLIPPQPSLLHFFDRSILDDMAEWLIEEGPVIRGNAVCALVPGHAEETTANPSA